MRVLLFLLIVASASAWPQTSSNKAPASNGQAPTASSSDKGQTPQPNLAPPRSDRVNADQLANGPGDSSSKDTQIDLSPPPDDAKAHPQSSEILKDESGEGSGSKDVAEFHPWDPHRAAKDVEVGDYYFKRKNYRAAEDRYREALLYKDNDAVATFRLAQCLEKLQRPDEALEQYESYLKILPNGPEAETCHKAIERLKGNTPKAQPAS